MTRMEKIIRAMNWKYPEEIPPAVAKHLLEMDELYECFIDDEYKLRTHSFATQTHSQNGTPPVRASNRSKSILRFKSKEERRSVVLELDSYRRKRGLSIRALSMEINSTPGCWTSGVSLSDWIKGQSTPGLRKTEMINDFLRHIASLPSPSPIRPLDKKSAVSTGQ
jgi:hypothetical protein